MSFLLFRSHPFLIAFILIWRFVLPLKLNKKIKLLLGVCMSLISLKLYVYLILGGSLMDPNLNRSASLILNALNFSALILALLVLLRDLINLIYKVLRFNFKAQLLKPYSLLCALILSGISFSLGIVGTYNAFKAPIITNYTISYKNLPPKAHNFSIAMLSDLHISAPISKEDVATIVSLTNAEKPDLIVITGDFVDGKVSDLKEKTDILFKLHARLGVYAVSGNHELYSGYKEWLHYLSAGGIKFLENTSTLIYNEEHQPLFNLAGVSDRNAWRFHETGPDFKKALAHIDTKLPTVMLCHQPSLAYDVVNKVELFLAGHTHGGQAPLIRNLVAAANLGLVSGLYKLENTDVIVSNGTKLWMGFPLRLNTPGEIVKITLKSE